jgi:hypothetical protein
MPFQVTTALTPGQPAAKKDAVAAPAAVAEEGDPLGIKVGGQGKPAARDAGKEGGQVGLLAGIGVDGKLVEFVKIDAVDAVAGEVEGDGDKPASGQFLTDVRKETPILKSLETVTEDDDRLPLPVVNGPHLASEGEVVADGEGEGGLGHRPFGHATASLLGRFAAPGAVTPLYHADAERKGGHAVAVRLVPAKTAHTRVILIRGGRPWIGHSWPIFASSWNRNATPFAGGFRKTTTTAWPAPWP